MDFKGSQTEKNLLEAFSGESMARNKYTFYASQARKDGYEYIARIFDETANNEKEHAKIWFKYLNNGSISDTKSLYCYEPLESDRNVIYKCDKKVIFNNTETRE